VESLNFITTGFPSWCIAALCLLAGCWLQTALGFGMAVVAAPVIVMIKPEWVPVALTVSALFLSTLNSWNQRRYIQLRKMIIPFVTRLPGTALGLWLLLQLNAMALQICVAIVVLLAVVFSLFGRQFDYTAGRLGVAAFISGIMGTTTSVGGPPMALVMQFGEPQVIRANLSLYFAYSCTVSLTGYYFSGLLQERLFVESLSFLPFCLLGYFFGIKAQPYVDAGRFRSILLLLCATTGLFALIGALIKLC
jgi:uncharacterized protein